MRQPFEDAQSALGFVMEQGYSVEAKVYELKYPNFDMRPHVPIVTEGNEWGFGTIFFSMDTVGKANWVSGHASDIPFAEALRTKFNRTFYMFASGYEWDLEEINQAMMLGRDISADKGIGARRAMDQFQYNVGILGSTEKNYAGLINSSEVSRVTIAVGASTSTLWSTKTAAERYADMNALLSSVNVNTGEVEYADTLRLTPAAFRLLASTGTGLADGTLTQLEFFRKNNVYTATTGQALDILPLRSLTGAGLGGLDRMMVFRKDQEVVRFHLPMPSRMLPPRQKSILGYEVGMICRTGGTEWRLPAAAAYGDGT